MVLSRAGLALPPAPRIALRVALRGSNVEAGDVSWEEPEGCGRVEELDTARILFGQGRRRSFRFAGGGRDWREGFREEFF